METKKGIIERFDFLRTFTSKDDAESIFYVYNCIMQTGEYGELTCKLVNKYKVGDEIEYTLSSRTYNGKEIWSIKIVPQKKSFNNYNPQRELSIIKQSTSNMAINLICAGKIELKDFEKWQKYFEQYIKS